MNNPEPISAYLCILSVYAECPLSTSNPLPQCRPLITSPHPLQNSPLSPLVCQQLLNINHQRLWCIACKDSDSSSWRLALPSKLKLIFNSIKLKNYNIDISRITKWLFTCLFYFAFATCQLQKCKILLLFLSFKSIWIRC